MQPPVWAGLALILVSFEASASLAPTRAITEADAVRIFLDESPQARLVSLNAEAAGAELSTGTEVSNPSVAYQIEDAAGVRDEFLTFHQDLPITGRRSLLRERAAAASAATELLGERELQDAAYSLKNAFYDVLYRDRVVTLLRRGEEELERTVEVLRERERQGEGSGYDVLRAEQEMTELQLDLGMAKAASTASRARFGSFLDETLGTESAAFEGDFSLARSSLTADEAVAMALVERTDLLALQEEARREELESRAARRERFPEPTLSAGWKRVEAVGESDTGFVASLMVPLPVFDRGKFAAARANAASGQIELRREILEREIRADVESALARAQAAREAAERFGDQVEWRAGELRRIAQLAYDEGEKGILELLDAFRTSLRMELQALDARHEAKRGQIELHRVMGREVRP
ncbi:MAG: TolC family protein [Planctomycetota bacterium]|jgi:cobalt-zinc-cadmium efflux system outer membrane protein